MFLHQEVLQGNPGRSMKHLPHCLWLWESLQALFFGGSIPSWVLRKGRKSFLSAGKAVTQGQPGERRCPRLSRDFVTDSEAPGCAQFVLGYKMNPAEPVPGSLCSCLAAQASRACWICLLLPCSLPPWAQCCQKGWAGAQELLNG